MAEEIILNVVCSTCDRPNPQATRGCDRPDCGWRVEAIQEILADGGSLHVVCGPTNNSREDIAEGRLNIWLEARPRR